MTTAIVEEVPPQAKGKKKADIDPNDFEQYLVSANDVEVHGADHVDVAALGKGITLEKEDTVTINGAKAEKLWKELLPFKQAHPIRKGQVESLYEAMRNNLFRPEWVNFIVATYKGELYRLNARHTMLATISYARNVDPKFEMEVKRQHYACKTYADLRILYANIDRNHARTPSNVIRAYLKDSEEFGRYTDDLIKAASEGFALWLWPTHHERRNNGPDKRAYLMQTEYTNLIHNVCKFLGESKHKDYRFLWRAGVVGAMFATYNLGVSASTEFWRSIREAVGFKRSRELPPKETGGRATFLHDPRRLLRDNLTLVSVSDRGGTRKRRKASSEDLYRWSAYAWNAYQSKEMMALLRTEQKGERPKFDKPQ
jgi:hypothetical protein